MTTGMNSSDQQEPLLNRNSVIFLCGTVSLAAYWAWIFTTYSSLVINPFGIERVDEYSILLIVSAGLSAVCMLATSFVPEIVERLFQEFRGTVVLIAASCVGCMPALLYQLGYELSFVDALVPWAIAACSSSIILIKTGRFFVWLKRSKVSRGIALSFFGAAVLYALPQLLSPVIAVVCVLCMPALSCVSARLSKRLLRAQEPASADDAEPSRECTACNDPWLSRLAELKHFVPLTLIYTVSFGVVSFVVLNLAASSDLVFVIVLSIVVSSLFLMICTFVLKLRIEVDRFQRELLALIAIALLPFPYVPVGLKVAFLSFAVFGFTCFDAIGWGDLADEVRDRKLNFYRYTSLPTSINFFGIFAGWGLGGLIFKIFGEEGFLNAFEIVIVFLVTALIVYLVIARNGEEAAEPSVSQTVELRDEWKRRCEKTAANAGLTNQEERVFALLARGRSYGFIANELCISSHTVKTHVYHIYRKLDIHSQQELINLVEGTHDSTPKLSGQ